MTTPQSRRFLSLSLLLLAGVGSVSCGGDGAAPPISCYRRDGSVCKFASPDAAGAEVPGSQNASHDGPPTSVEPGIDANSVGGTEVGPPDAPLGSDGRDSALLDSVAVLPPDGQVDFGAGGDATGAGGSGGAGGNGGSGGGGYADGGGDTRDVGPEASPDLATDVRDTLSEMTDGPRDGADLVNQDALDATDGLLDVNDVLGPSPDGDTAPAPDVPAPDLPPDVTAPPLTVAYAHNFAVGGIAGLALDPAGNPYFAATLYGTANIGSASLTTAGGNDLVLARLDPTSGLVTSGAGWAKNFGDAQDQVASGVAVSQSSHVGAIGNFAGTITMAPGISVTNSGTTAIDFMVATDGAGTGLWAKSVDTQSGALLAIAANPGRDEFAICGYAAGGVTDLGLSGAYNGDGLEDILIAKLNSATGAVIWAHQIGGAGSQLCTAVAMDAAGTVYAGGIYDGSLDFGSGALPSPSGQAVWVAKLSSAAGTEVVSAAYGASGNGYQNVRSIAVDGSGNVAIAGNLKSSMAFGSYNLTAPGSGTDGFVAKLSNGLAPLWARNWGDSGNQEAHGVASSPSGDLVVVGFAKGTTTGLASSPLVAAGTSADAYWARFRGSDGASMGAAIYGDPLVQSADNVVIAGSGVITVSGYFTGTMTFATSPSAISVTSTVMNGFLLGLTP